MIETRTLWRTSLVGATVAAAALEFAAVISSARAITRGSRSELEPLTHVIRDNVPPEWTAAGVVGLSTWLIVHFHRAYSSPEAAHWFAHQNSSPDAR